MLSKNIRYFSTSLSQFARSRSKQILFRKALIDKYSKCAITDIHPNLCDACHIIPYSVSNNYDVNNGILLSKNMHAAFDRKYFTIDEKSSNRPTLREIRLGKLFSYTLDELEEWTEFTIQINHDDDV